MGAVFLFVVKYTGKENKHMTTCAQCHTSLPLYRDDRGGLRFCGIKCCRAYHGDDIDRRVRDDSPPFTATRTFATPPKGHNHKQPSGMLGH